MNLYAKKYHRPDEKELPPKSFGPIQKTTDTPVVQPSSVTLTDIPEDLRGSISTPNLTHRVLAKMAFGSSAADLAHINSLPGATETDRIMAYIDEQLEPGLISDTVVDNMLTQGFQTLNKTQQQFFQEHVHIPGGGDIPWDIHIQPGRETVYATFIRAINSKRQLQEMMADFWHNHFNVYMEGDNIQPMFVHYDRDVIRPEALGNFRNMLYEVTRSNCMLSYLGNGVNEQSAPNENYARELLELHTISAANYLGHMPWQDVPIDGQGRRVGYVETDVQELARALTGWSFSGASWQDYQYLYDPPININLAPTGLFMFRSSWHDQGVKRVMGVDFFYDSNDPEKDVNDILDMLAEHPATAQFLALKLCRRFIADEPPQSIVDQVANSLQQNWQAPDQIKQAMEVLLKSNEFLTTWGGKIRRPFERLVAALRQIEYTFSFDPTVEYTNWHHWGFMDSGQHPFHWTSPNGYPDYKSHWLGSSSTMATWKFIQWTSRFRDGNNGDVPFNQIVDITKAAFPNPADRTANNMVDYWYERACGVVPDANTQDKLAKFMSYQDNSNPVGTDRDTPIDLDSNDWPGYNQERLFAVVSTMFLTADFSYR
jgi:uncharacterized protein (DUF1800 family)